LRRGTSRSRCWTQSVTPLRALFKNVEGRSFSCSMALGSVVASHVVWVGRSVEGNNSSYDSKVSYELESGTLRNNLRLTTKLATVHLAYCPQKSARWHNWKKHANEGGGLWVQSLASEKTSASRIKSHLYRVKHVPSSIEHGHRASGGRITP
jgi:hypothetical protein